MQRYILLRLTIILTVFTILAMAFQAQAQFIFNPCPCVSFEPVKLRYDLDSSNGTSWQTDYNLTQSKWECLGGGICEVYLTYGSNAQPFTENQTHEIDAVRAYVAMYNMMPCSWDIFYWDGSNWVQTNNYKYEFWDNNYGAHIFRATLYQYNDYLIENGSPLVRFEFHFPGYGGSLLCDGPFTRSVEIHAAEEIQVE